jgi:glycosyltransferase involved in cell wall biosynthesis
MNTSECPLSAGDPVLVSVVIPTRGRPEVVQRAIRSALGQTFRELEVIVVVDGEDTATIRALQSVNDARLHIVGLPISVGGSEARNIGVRTATSEWIAFLDDDDEWFPHKIERQFALATEMSIKLPVICSAYIGRSAEGDSVFGRRTPDQEEHIADYMFCRDGFSYGENAIATSVLLVPRSLMLLVPFDPVLRRHQDWDWALRALSRSDTSLHYLAEPLSIYSMEDSLGRISSQNDWRYSLKWCQDRKSLLTQRAFSFFIVTECLTRARTANASFAELASLLRTYWCEGQPSYRSAMLAAVYLLTSKKMRRMMI